MRIFIIQPNFTSNSETWLLRMNKMLIKNVVGFASFLTHESFFEQIHVFNLNGRNPSKFERILVRLRIFKYDRQKTMRKELLDAIKRSHADKILIHYATTANDLWDVIKQFSIPVYIYVHGYDIIWDHNDDFGKRIHHDSYSNDILEISKHPNVFFIVNSGLSYKNLQNIGADMFKVFKKAYGVSVPKINRNYCKDEMTILFLGRFVDFKGPDIVLKAFLSACSLGFKGKLVMAGDGVLKSYCEKIASESIYSRLVTFTGAVYSKEAMNLFLSADIYSMHNCMGSTTQAYEMLGVTLIEALSYGLPVVTSTVGGPSEIIENEVDGILVHPNNVEEHAAAFVRLYNDRNLCARLGNNGRNKILKHYSSDIEEKALFEILHIN